MLQGEVTKTVGAGVVYTRQWTVELMLDLAGYTPDRDLVGGTIVEPSCGEGAFLIEIVRRLLVSATSRAVPIRDLVNAVRAFEIDGRAANMARARVKSVLLEAAVDPEIAESLTTAWILERDFLLEAPSESSARWVVGNPPYVRVGEVDHDLAVRYRNLWPLMRRRADLYIGFFEAGLRSLEDGGVQVFIAPDRWMRNQYGEPLRRLLDEDFALELVVDLHSTQPFASRVAAYPAVTVIRRSPPSSTDVLRVRKGVESVTSGMITQGRAATQEPLIERSELLRESGHRWAFAPQAHVERLRRSSSTFLSLEETGAVVRAGIATGADRVFVTSDSTLVERAALTPVVGPKDLRSGELSWVGRYLVNPWRDGDLLPLASQDLPRLFSYFEDHKRELQNRYVSRRNPETWWRTIDRPVDENWRRPKLLIADINHQIEPVLAGEEFLPLNTLFYITSSTWDLEVLGGLLMSETAGDSVRAYSVAMSSGSLRMSAQYLRLLRIPAPDEISAEDAKRLTTAFRSRDRGEASRIGARLLGG
ncbi:Eco57I restriction-modification methylase domain-containing protein [Microbacterium sp. C5A9]|uniref:Eco57I restriction-modification methylase domain-containing protein n=1 Tax=Microbacterium sp. C5A9 TaxID=2736663 RepID=UPI001F524409|nr:Eco57I restriction-modification methylase domain-containing protein [Microbacterium sp. C5A9]MCI1019661.1 Eco57I restriction-modification methylase domain-containing protein [Microbacterium sp. C5A9]